MRMITSKPMIERTAKPAKRPKAALSAATLLASATLFACIVSPQASLAPETAPRFYLRFDRNIYPGDAALPILRKTFVFTSYWLSPPPGEKINTWLGKREFLRSLGFGFLVLHRGPESAELKNKAAAKQNLTQDAKTALAAPTPQAPPSAT